MRKRLDLGVIGLGNMGKNHVRVATNNAYVRDVFVFDENCQAVNATEQAFECVAVRSLDELFDKTDAVIIAADTSSHFELAKRAIEAESHCLIEKPITETVLQAKEIELLARLKNRVVSIGHIERFNPIFIELSNILKSEKAFVFDAERLSYNVDRANDVSVVLDLMIHDIDAMNYLTSFGTELVGTSGYSFISRNLDFVSAAFRGAEGLIYNLSASKVSQTRSRKLRISCEDCFIEADYLQRQIIINRNGSSEYLHRSRQIGYRQHAIIEQVVVPNIEPLLAEQVDFLRSIIEGREPLVSIYDGLMALDVATRVESDVHRHGPHDGIVARSKGLIT
jgi:predicted dehydrogenase